MVVTALGLLLGARADAGAVRSGQRAGRSSRAAGSSPEDGPVAERVRDAGGDLDGRPSSCSAAPSRARAAAGPSSAAAAAPVGVLAELGEQLVVVHGQSDQIRLRSSTAQREALDRFAGARARRPCSPSTAQRSRALAARTAKARRPIAERPRPSRARGRDAARRPRRDRGGRPAARRGRRARRARRAAHATSRTCASPRPRPASSSRPRSRRRRRRRRRRCRHRPAPARAGRRARRRARTRSSSRSRNASFLVAEIAAELSSYLAGLDTDGARELETRAGAPGRARRAGPQVRRRPRRRARLRDRRRHPPARTRRRLRPHRGPRRDAIAADSAAVEELADAGQRHPCASRQAGSRQPSPTSSPRSPWPTRGSSSRSSSATSSRRHGRDVGRDPAHARTPAPSRGRSARGASGGELSRVMLAIEVVIAATRPRADLRLRRGRRRCRRCGRDRDRATTRPARRVVAGDRRHAPRPGRGVRHQPPARREGQRRAR